MRLFGILLIFANLAAGAGFVYLATQDWKARQSINAAGVRHLLLLQGLPLEPAPGAPEGFSADDETPFIIEMGGGESTKTISKKLLELYFTSNAAYTPPPATNTEPAPVPSKVPLGGTDPVTSQVAEVKRVRGLIDAELAKDGQAADKVALLRGWLLYQAENYDIRLQYLELTSSTDPATGFPKTPEKIDDDFKKLKAILDARFDAVLNKHDGSRTAPAPNIPDVKKLSDDLKDLRDRKAPEADIKKARDELTEAIKQGQSQLDQNATQRAAGTQDETERRMRLVHLLVHLDQDPAWQKRIIAVVGLRRYVKAITLQVLRFGDMLKQVEEGIPGDQAAFSSQEALLREKAIQNAERAKAVAEERAKLVEQKTLTDDSVNRRRTQLKELTDQLIKVKTEVDELLLRQSGIEKQLFEIQREVGLTLEDVYRLEALLDATERERFGLPPRPRP